MSNDLSPLPLRHRPARRLTQLMLGLIAYGASVALLVQSRLGNMPWDVFHQGLSGVTGLSLGVIIILVGAAVLLLWLPLRQRPGIGTVSNVIVLGLATDATMFVLPAAGPIALKIGYLIGGVLLCGLASGLYIGARLGPGPRDGLMTGLAARGLSIRFARTGIEVAVVAIGFLLGGTLGVGTVVYALTIGPIVHLMLPWFTIASPSTQRPVERPEVVDEQVGLLERREVAAPGHIGPAHDPVTPLHNGSRRDELSLAGEHGDAGGHVDAYPRGQA
jgi:uncharacterized membrane protein YczE